MAEIQLDEFFPPEWNNGRDARRKGFPRHRNPYNGRIEWDSHSIYLWYLGWDYEDTLEAEERAA